MSRTKLLACASLVATALGLFYFQGDIQRYVKMKRM